MNCERFEGLQAAGALGDLRPEEQRDLERHLADCAACARRLRELVLTTEMLKGLAAWEEAETPPPLHEGLVQRILAARRAEGTERRADRRAV